MCTTPKITLRYSDHSNGGCSCRFYTRDGEPDNPNKMGLKVYDEEQVRDDAHRCQHIFHEAELAPPVGAKVLVQESGAAEVEWGMYTGIAILPDTVGSKAQIEWWCNKLNLSCWAAIERHFIKMVGDHGLDSDDFDFLNDVHCNNLGLWMDKLVLIDFSY